MDYFVMFEKTNKQTNQSNRKASTAEDVSIRKKEITQGKGAGRTAGSRQLRKQLLAGLHPGEVTSD